MPWHDLPQRVSVLRRKVAVLEGRNLEDDCDAAG